MHHWSPELLSLPEEKLDTFFNKGTHGYGLGVRCPNGDARYVDFGWGGAADSFLAVDMAHGISLFWGAHILSCPAQGIRSMLYRMVRAELYDPADLPVLAEDLKRLHHYTATY